MRSTSLLRKRKRRVASLADMGDAFMVATSQHEFVPGEQVARKVVAYSHVKSGCWFSGRTEELQCVPQG